MRSGTAILCHELMMELLYTDGYVLACEATRLVLHHVVLAKLAIVFERVLHDSVVLDQGITFLRME